MTSKIKTAILDDYQQVAFQYADWSSISPQLDITVYTDTIHSEDDLVSRLEPYTIICTMRERTRFPASVLARLPHLKLLTTTAMRNASIDIEFAKKKGIIVSGTGLLQHTTVEHTWALILGLVKNVAREDASVRHGKWQETVEFSLIGKTIGLLGVGNLGSETARIAKAFGMIVLGWSPNLTPERAVAAGVTFAPSKHYLLENSDIVSVHLVLSPTTRGILSAEDLEHLKPGSYLVNTSRGPLIDEPALLSLLRSKKIRGAALDVFDIEPLPLDHEFRRLENVLLSPHLGYVTEDNYKVFWGQTVENIAAFLEGTPKRVI